jgi:UDP-glucose 4-epimerase
MQKNNSNKVVIIGGSGFIGSHTADELSARGFDVTIFDCVKSRWLRKDQKIVIGDAFDNKLLEKTIKDARYVYHFAGVADIDEAKINPFHTINMNVMGVTTTLEAAVKTGVERFVYASTMYVYSSRGSFYRASKQAAETIIEAYAEEYDIEYTLLRYGSLYGPRSQTWNGLRKYTEQIVREGRLDYNGTGKERREYIHVKDASRLSVDILERSYKNRAITVTGQQVLNSQVLIEMIFEIAAVKYNTYFSKNKVNEDHYETTPYRYNPQHSMKLVPDEFVDIGQGILDIVAEIHDQMDSE